MGGGGVAVAAAAAATVNMTFGKLATEKKKSKRKNFENCYFFFKIYSPFVLYVCLCVISPELKTPQIWFFLIFP